ncbi:hypothetical protein LTR37_015721 [Vermiconidia calcicola]|uniref:Uncharacterized protein n=1 Tax=Vermiconidia calcicola TaxID=1690605 RepID=A0ACC3MQS6_9PEZI|nr:hypothetical protein LTR37_015721 [Vermiconidia calcicola]
MADRMDSPNKRLKPSPPQEASADFVPLGDDDDEQDTDQYGYNNAFPDPQQADQSISQAPRAPRAMYQQNQNYQHHDRRDARNDPRNAKDRPKSKHVLPNHEPWILLGRRFVHNTSTKESLWWIPKDVMPGVLEFERWEVQVKEKEANAKWAEEQLKGMRGTGTGSNAVEVGKRRGDGEGRDRRRRSESLQREDEEAMMAEIAKEAEKGEERDVKETVKNLEGLQPKLTQPEGGDAGYGSDSSYEEVEVTDSEFEDDEERQQERAAAGDGEQAHEQGPVEFGEDDIAYQLAAMEDYGNGIANDNDGPYSDVEKYEEDASEEVAAHIFRQLLDDHKISPFTPWETLIADNSPPSIIMDDRYTVLSTTRARKEVWKAWVKETAARLKEERAKMENKDPRIPYLAFLAEKASPKLYWPEFKRKFKKEPVMNERALGEKERERLYRDHINRLKLPESTRKADLVTLLKGVPLKDLNKGTSMDTLPQQLLSHLHYISLPPATRDPVIAQHISTLPTADEDEDDDGELTMREQSRNRKREKALAERERKVEDERRKAEKEGNWAKRELREEERELQRAMEVGKGGLRERLRGE